MLKQAIIVLAPFLLMASTTICEAECRSTKGTDTDIAVAPKVTAMLNDHGLSGDDLFRAMHETSQFETSGCWAGSSNPDAQFLSVGIMQWNLGKGSLQPLLRAYLQHFDNMDYRRTYIKKLMPTFGERFFENCLESKVTSSCKDTIYAQWRDLSVDDNPKLKSVFASELDQLFNDRLMRQIQIDLYAKAFTSSVDDFQNIYHDKKPAYWQEAWAIDVKTQLGRRVLTDKAIRLMTESVDRNAGNAFESTMLWYESACLDGVQHSNKTDCRRNQELWPLQKARLVSSDTNRLITLLFTQRIAETIDVSAKNGVMKYGSGEWKLNTFTRKATIAIGVGYVHATKIDDLSSH